MKIWITLLFSITLLGFSNTENDKKTWVESKVNAMSEDEKIGQLFIIRAHSDKGSDHINFVKKQINKYHVGGLCFFQGTPEKQAQLTNTYQALSKTPLIIAMDAEWGLGMRLKSDAISFPMNMMLGAISDQRLIQKMGKEIGRQLSELGVHLNFAPVVDVNNNPDNPVINYRSFGEDRYNVAAKSLAYAQGLAEANVMACAKHFPGHGDTNTDSHYDLPVITHSKERLDSLELYPFKVLSKNNVGSVMVAHLNIPAYDDRPNRPTTLSKNAVTGVLKDYLGFDGLIITDALEMQGVAKHFSQGRVEVEALIAGNDILLMPIDIDKAFNAIKKALKNNELSWDDINQKLKKILGAKYDLGLTETPQPIEDENIRSKINTKAAEALINKLKQNAITLVRDKQKFVPVEQLNKRYAVVSIGVSEKTVFQKQFDKYGQFDHFQIPKNLSSTALTSWKDQLSKYDELIISVHDMSQYASKNFGLTASVIGLVNQLSKSNKSLVCLFGSPYGLSYFPNLKSVMVAYDDEPNTQSLSAQGIMGAFSFKGTLPVSAGDNYILGRGILSPGLLRLSYGLPEEVGMSSDSLMAIDTIVEEMIKEKAAPGCQILVAKSGKIVYHKSFGYHTYDQSLACGVDDLYDVASLTKVMATTLALMKLSDENKLNTSLTIGEYLTGIDTTNKSDLIINEVLAHQAGLAGWIPFYSETQSKDKTPKVMDKYYRTVASDSFPIQVANDLFLRFDYPDSIYAMIYNNDLKTNKNYRYSDLGFYLFQQIVKTISGSNVDEYCYKEFYDPLGLMHTCFNPLEKFDLDQIVPSEKDEYYRNQTVHGHVHDMGAAMLGGVGGHAGLFSSGNELAVLAQMLLNGGYYGGKQYIRPSTIKQFSTRFPRSTRRGLGFDMKQLDPEKVLNMSEKASESTFGHLGFTGTALWIDPEHDLIYVFLSNRTYPTMKNRKFGKNEYRPRIQSVLYNAMN
jgi:beta-glucosidase-like glycosyl hydrolase/CubicO group peptidase (beta-lactamase class C family)